MILLNRYDDFTKLREIVLGEVNYSPLNLIKDAKIDNDVNFGPYARLRPGTVLQTGSKIGNFSDASFYSFEWGKPISLGLGGASKVKNSKFIFLRFFDFHHENRKKIWL